MIGEVAPDQRPDRALGALVGLGHRIEAGQMRQLVVRPQSRLAEQGQGGFGGGGGEGQRERFESRKVGLGHAPA